MVLCFLTGMGLIFFLPFKGARSYTPDRPAKRIHEADVVLSRRLLLPGSESHKSYYRSHPEFLEADEKARKAPGLLGHNSLYFHPFALSGSNLSNSHKLPILI